MVCELGVARIYKIFLTLLSNAFLNAPTLIMFLAMHLPYGEYDEHIAQLMRFIFFTRKRYRRCSKGCR